METKTEIWKDIEGYEGMYQVSNLGRVRSLDRYIPAKCALSKTDDDVLFFRKGKIIKLWKVWGGYFRAGLSKGDKAKMITVHRLVAKAFIPNPDNLPEVNHIDEDKSNNRADNLEWCTHIQNEHHGTKIERATQHGHRPRPVYQMTMDGEIIRRFASMKAAEKTTGISAKQILGCCRGDYGYKSAHGFRWKYAEE